MRRREIVGFLAGLAATWPLATRAQQPATRIIGLLSGGSAEAFEPLGTAFRIALEAEGFVEGTNLRVESRWANGHFDRLPSLAADLIGRNPSVIATVTLPAASAAKAATDRIPIVFVVGDDPVEAGLVTSLNRPGGNVTGLTNFTTALGGKRLELASEALPSAATLALLVNWDNSNAEREARDFQAAAGVLGRRVRVIAARTDSGIEAVFATAAAEKIGALFVSFDPVFFARREQIIALAAQYRLPTIYPLREFVLAGGLMSYGPSFVDVWRQAAVYTGKILNGEKSADLPVRGPSKFELFINRQTARAVGLELPRALLTRADRIVE